MLAADRTRDAAVPYAAPARQITERPHAPSGVAAFMSVHSTTPYITPSMVFPSGKGVAWGRRGQQLGSPLAPCYPLACARQTHPCRLPIILTPCPYGSINTPMSTAYDTNTLPLWPYQHTHVVRTPRQIRAAAPCASWRHGVIALPHW